MIAKHDIAVDQARGSGDEEFIMFRASAEIMYHFCKGVEKNAIIEAIETDITSFDRG